MRSFFLIMFLPIAMASASRTVCQSNEPLPEGQYLRAKMARDLSSKVSIGDRVRAELRSPLCESTMHSAGSHLTLQSGVTYRVINEVYANIDIPSTQGGVIEGTVTLKPGVEFTTKEVYGWNVRVYRIRKSSASGIKLEIRRGDLEERTVIVPQGSFIFGKVVSISWLQKTAKQGSIDLLFDSIWTTTGRSLGLNARPFENIPKGDPRLDGNDRFRTGSWMDDWWVFAGRKGGASLKRMPNMGVLPEGEEELKIKKGTEFGLVIFRKAGGTFEGITEHRGSEGVEDSGMVPVSSGTYELSFSSGGVTGGDEGMYSVDNHFLMDKWEVTNAEYAAYLTATGGTEPASWKDRKYPAGKGQAPVLVTWREAGAYAKWAGKRLMTFPEWVAAIAGSQSTQSPWMGKLGSQDKERLHLFPLRQSITELAAFVVDVGGNKVDRSEGGICDLLGNALEWTSTPVKESLEKDNKLIFKLGGFFVYQDWMVSCLRSGPDQLFGFRCVKDANVMVVPGKQERGLFVDPRDGKRYRTLRIGNQTWMLDNLDFDTNEGCWCYDNDSSKCVKYGRLYTWDAAKKASPPGWHLPSKQEWEMLLKDLGGQNEVPIGQVLQGGSSGFDVLLAGRYFSYKGTFEEIGETASYWSSGKDTRGFIPDAAWTLHVSLDYGKAYFYSHGYSFGLSVRCVKD